MPMRQQSHRARRTQPARVNYGCRKEGHDMDASTHGSYGMGGGGALVVSPDFKCLYTVLIFVHSFDGVRHAGCVGVWSGGARS